MDYKGVKKANERAAIAALLDRHNDLFQRKLVVICRPDPPDALAKDSGGCIWIEACNAYFSTKWAEDLHSFAAEDKNHSPMPSVCIQIWTKNSAIFFGKLFLKKMKRLTTMNSLVGTEGDY